MTSTRTFLEPKLGDRAYEVEWISDLPMEEWGADWDRATYQVRIVKTKAEARRLARKVKPGLPVEVVTITPVEFMDIIGCGYPHHFQWEACGEKEEIS